MGELPHDLRGAVRQLQRAPGFTAIAVLTLGLIPARRAASFDPLVALRYE